MKTITYLLPFFLFFQVHFASSASFQFDKISPEEMNLERWIEKYPDQPAVVIGDIGECWFEFCSKNGHPQYLLKRSFRMIILKPEGMGYGNFPIPYYESRTGKEELSKIKGNVFNLENEKVKRTRVRESHGYTTDLGNNWKELIIPFPEIKAGSVFEIEYQIRSDYIQELPGWKVQRGIPVVFNKFILRLPAFFTYMLNLRNQNIVKQVEKKPFRENFRINVGENLPYGGLRPRFHNFTVEAIQYTWESRNVPPMLPEPYTDNINNYRAEISLELMKIEYPESPPRLFSQTLESVRDYLFKQEDFGQFLIDAPRTIISYFDHGTNGNFDDDILKATQEIRQKIKWNRKPGKFATGTPNEILNMGSGNSADVNLILCALIRQMGYNAQPLLLSTVNNGSLISDNPTISKLNYVIVAVEAENNKWILVDGTADGLPPGFLPGRALNGKGKLLLPEKPIWIDLKNINDRSIKKEYIVWLRSDGSVQGNFRYEYHGYSKHIEKTRIQNQADDNALVVLENKFGIEKDLIKVENLDYTEEPLVLSADFELDNVGIQAGGEIILPLLLFETISSHPFHLEERSYPVSFSTPFSEEVEMQIVIPDGYEITHMPRSQTIRGVGGFQYSLQVENIDGELNITATATARNEVVSVQRYPAYRNYQDRIVQLHSQNTVISKK